MDPNAKSKSNIKNTDPCLGTAFSNGRRGSVFSQEEAHGHLI